LKISVFPKSHVKMPNPQIESLEPLTKSQMPVESFKNGSNRHLIKFDWHEFACGWGAAFVNITVTYPVYKMIFRQVSCVPSQHSNRYM
jgi:hypothetical protein